MCIPTHRSGTCLEPVFTSTPSVVACNIGIPIETSDPCYVFTTIRIEHAVPAVSSSSKIYIRSLADWGGILHALSTFNWPDVQKNIREKLYYVSRGLSKSI